MQYNWLQAHLKLIGGEEVEAQMRANGQLEDAEFTDYPARPTDPRYYPTFSVEAEAEPEVDHSEEQRRKLEALHAFSQFASIEEMIAILDLRDAHQKESAGAEYDAA